LNQIRHDTNQEKHESIQTHDPQETREQLMRFKILWFESRGRKKILLLKMTHKTYKTHMTQWDNDCYVFNMF